MGHKRMPGLILRGGIWHINKKVDGRRICESTGTSCLETAEKHLVYRLESIRQAKVYGVRPKRTFRDATVKFIKENAHKASLYDDICTIKKLDPFIGKLSLEAVHMGSLQSFIDARKQQGIKLRTINYGLQLVRHILNLAAGEWLDEYGLTWLASAPKIKLLTETDKRNPYPLSWEEQERLFRELPPHLEKMALFAVNTGCRDTEICSLRWNWEIPILGLDYSVFIIPKEIVKNREDRLVVLNRIAKSVIDELRGQHPEFVFSYNGKPQKRMLRTAWKKARIRAGLPQVRVHDLKHTFGRRLRAAGVCFEDRQDLLGHKSERITTHYSAAELSNLIEAANKVCDGQSGPVLVLLKKRAASRAKVAQGF
ncbi:MAG TPA: site-specific integrase [Candidatus Babeliales bacterium]|nr:site-specific integrase [Candidatus Babeliales bacterium]